MAKRRRSKLPTRTFLSWAVRGGHLVDVDGSVYHMGYLGWRCFDHLAIVPPVLRGCQIALFRTRAEARRAMKDGPKKRHSGLPGGKEWVWLPNAAVESVLVTIKRAP